jgi:hypothetical protein
MSNISSVLSQSGLLGSADTTPAGSITATQLATGAVTSAKLAASAVTVGKLGQSVLVPYSASGLASAGAITTTGTKVGDKVLAVMGFVTSSSVWVGLDTTHFEATVTVADQIQQSSGALSANTYIFLVQPQS